MRDLHGLTNGKDSQWCWDRYKSVLQTGGHRYRNDQCTLAEFTRRVYFCSHIFDSGENDGCGDASSGTYTQLIEHFRTGIYIYIYIYIM